MDTIYALSSGALPSGVAVVRISGPKTRFVLETIAGGVSAPRVAVLRRIRHPESRELVDRGLVLWFPGPSSFTGEDCAEIHIHGGNAVLQALFEAISCASETRLADPGEFARRAFENGKLDLTAVEGLADLIGAQTPAQHKQALQQAGGALRRMAEGWRERIIRIRSRVEASLDFAEEEDVPDSVSDTVWQTVRELTAEIESAIEGGNRGEIVRSGFVCVLLGRPNAGKSSLLNALAKRDIAIVAAEAGTTRDLLEAHLNLGGYAVTVVDTAGIRESRGKVEREGIRRALARAEQANLAIWLEPVDEDGEPEFLPPDVPVIVFRSKDDEGTAGPRGVSVERRDGTKGLENCILAHVEAAAGGIEAAAVTRHRHVEALSTAVENLRAAIDSEANGLDIQAEYLRLASDQIGKLTGALDVEDLLDVIFSEFCVGK